MDAPFYIRSFYKELIALYKKYDLSISHEDSHGSFIIENYNEHNVDWIMDADIKAYVPKFARWIYAILRRMLCFLLFF